MKRLAITLPLVSDQHRLENAMIVVDKVKTFAADNNRYNNIGNIHYLKISCVTCVHVFFLLSNEKKKKIFLQENLTIDLGIAMNHYTNNWQMQIKPWKKTETYKEQKGGKDFT